MGFLSGTWLRYVDRSYSTIKNTILTLKQANVPELTDHNESEPFVRATSVWAGIAEMLGYTTDNAARESLLDSCRLYSSAVSHARRADYCIFSSVPFSVDVNFVANAPLISNFTIPAGTTVKISGTNTTYVTTANAVMLAGTSVVSAPCEQKTRVANAVIGYSLGAVLEEYEIGNNIVNDSIVCRVAGVTWTKVRSFCYSIPNSQVFKQNVNKLQNTVIQFPDGYNGQKPTNGAVITADYYTTLGADGGAGVGKIDTIVTTLSLPSGVTLTVTNPLAASDGTGVETLEQLKRRIPLSIRTLDVCITRRNWVDITEMAAGVERAGVEFNCGKLVSVYIVPDGGGIASTGLINSTTAWLYDRTPIDMFYNVYAAGQIHVLLEIDLRVKPNYGNVTTTNAVISSLVAFGASANQQVRGTVQLSDVYQAIETTEGVSSSTVVRMTPIPFATKLAGSHILVWTKTVLNGGGSGIDRFSFKVVTAGVGSIAEYDLFLNNVFQGRFNAGDTHSYANIIWSIDGSSGSTYSLGDSWSFLVYPYYGTFTVQEPSIPIIDSSDITINATGGL